MKFKTLSCCCLIAIPLVLNTGCAVISENECQTGLWYERGVQDGARGQSQSVVYEIAQKCQEFGVRVDSELWKRGYEEGIEQFCTPENGFLLGRRGSSYSGVCTGPTADLFVYEYQRGLAEYQLEQQYFALRDRHDQLEYALETISLAFAATNDKDELRKLRKRRRKLRRELNFVDVEMRAMEISGAWRQNTPY